MAKPGPRTTYRYSDAFKATAVRLSQLPGVSVGDVATSLYIHPFMLSRWRRLAREGLIVTKGIEVDKAVAAELKALREVQRKYEQLKLEHDLLKKAIAFTSTRKAKSLPSSSTTRKRTR
ncbi:transposase [Novilysobacter spongiicola]|uniref:Transposase n=1 Tax=Lysobacter spongiicola DSM 21749 TaxID=1122188 RepID=A0A1T4QS24_9GAMM|nr:transposase [Lysobacter spongiicola]SKA06494.1 transposase [Lysobacter spongiicola DSM 21749]